MIWIAKEFRLINFNFVFQFRILLGFSLALGSIVDDLAFTQGVYTSEEEVLKVLNIVHTLEPTGVGARNLQECLLLQLKQKPKGYIWIYI